LASATGVPYRPSAPRPFFSMIRPHVLSVALVAAVVALVGCGRRPQAADEFPRNETVFIAIAWGEPTSFNPILPNPSWPAGQNHTAVYEPLFFFNQETGNLEPHIAESHRILEDRIEVTLRPDVHWNDGRPLTARDVDYSFNQIYRIVPGFLAWQYLSAVRVLDPEAERPRRLAFVFNPKNPNPLMVLHWLSLNFVLPEHAWKPLLEQTGRNFEKLSALKLDQNPVASGPYRLHSSSAEKIVLVRDDAYWGNKALFDGRLPAARFLVAPIYKSNDHYSMALQQGRIDASNTFIPRIWLKARKGVQAWFDEPPYFPPGCIPTAVINHLRPHLQDVHLRRALAFAINYGDIKDLAVSGYSIDHVPGFILPFGTESRYFVREDAEKYGTWFDPERARKELAAGGYTSVYKDGELVEMRDRTGKRVPTLFVQSPTGWSDWESIVRIMVRGMRSAGIDAREQFVDATAYFRALPVGDFDLILTTPSNVPSPAEPWSRFNANLNTRDWAPLGERMYSNVGRFNQPGSPGYVRRIDELLERIPLVQEETERAALYRELNRLCMELQPSLPLVYRPKSFYEFNEKAWRGFATSEKPFLPPNIPSEGPGIRALWYLTPVESN
jgi:peptide/nickel transport system substrate-binding protein